MPTTGVNLATRPHGVILDFHDHIASKIVKIIVEVASGGALYPAPQGIIDIAGRRASTNRGDAVLGIIGVGTRSIIDNIARSIVSNAVASRDMICGCIKGELCALSGWILVPAVGIAVHIKAEVRTTGFVRSGDAAQWIVAVAPVAVNAIVRGCKGGIRRVSHDITGTRPA